MPRGGRAGKVRRYCAANRLNRLGTLTYAGSGNHDPARAPRRPGASSSGGSGAPSASASRTCGCPSGIPGGHGLHAHFAVGRWIAHGAIKRAWGRGIVHIKLLGDLPVGSGTLGEARLAARYLAKYVGKDLAAAAAAASTGTRSPRASSRAAVPIDGATSTRSSGWAETYMGAPADGLALARRGPGTAAGGVGVMGVSGRVPGRGPRVGRADVRRAGLPREGRPTAP